MKLCDLTTFHFAFKAILSFFFRSVAVVKIACPQPVQSQCLLKTGRQPWTRSTRLTGANDFVLFFIDGISQKSPDFFLEIGKFPDGIAMMFMNVSCLFAEFHHYLAINIHVLVIILSKILCVRPNNEIMPILNCVFFAKSTLIMCILPFVSHHTHFYRHETLTILSYYSLDCLYSPALSDERSTIDILNWSHLLRI